MLTNAEKITRYHSLETAIRAKIKALQKERLFNRLNDTTATSLEKKCEDALHHINNFFDTPDLWPGYDLIERIMHENIP